MVASAEVSSMTAEMDEAGRVEAADGASPRMYWGFVLGYIVLSAAHLLVVTHDPTGQYLGSYIVFGLVQWLTIAILIWRWRRSNFPNTLRWGLVIVAMIFVHLVNDIAFKRTIYGQHNAAPGAVLSCSAVYVALVVLSCSTTFRRGTVRVTNLIDGAMAIALTALFFVQIFSVVTLNGTDNPNNALFFVRMFDVLGVFMTLCASMRLLGATKKQRRHFFFVLAAYLLTSTIFAALRNRLLLAYEKEYLELLLLPQLLVFGLLCLRPLPSWLERYEPRPFMVYVTESLSPLFLGLGLLGVSISIWNGHPTLGAAGASVAVIGYGIRNVIAQSEQMATERSLLVLQDELQNLVVTDPLTGIANRRCFDQILKLEWNRAMRTQSPLSLLLIDIDYFKNLNDTYGHLYGDQCLVEIAAALRSALPRSGDLVARYGGEEFAVILPATNINGAESVAGRLQDAVRSLNIRNETSIGCFVTLSIGIAVYEFPQAGSPAALIEASDRALYMAKQNGRNRIEYSSA